MSSFARRRLCPSALVLAAWWLAACGVPDPVSGRGEPWEAADGLFHRDTRFAGADGAYSIALGDDRVLWLFGDTFAARDRDDLRNHAYFLRNSVAIQTGLDPTTAFMRFYWRFDGDDSPRSFFPEPSADRWFWPGHGIRIDDTLLVFGGLLRQDGAPGPTSFADDGNAAFVIDDPDAEPTEWVPRSATLYDFGDATQLGEAVLREGDWLYVFGTRGTTHSVVLVRFAVADAVRGDLSRPQSFCGGAFSEGCTPSVLFTVGAPELSVHFDETLARFVYVASAGYGSSVIVWRTAPRPEGPWSDALEIYRPVESFRDGAFVYAGKAHPELTGGGLAITYVPSAFNDDVPRDLQDRTYVPHFARVFPSP